MTEKEQRMRQWARDNYKAGAEIDEMWNDLVVDECRIINEEAAAKRAADKARIKEVVLSVDALEEEFKGNIVLYASFRGSLPKTKKLTKSEKTIVLKADDQGSDVYMRVGVEKPLFGDFPEYEELESARHQWAQQLKAFGIPFFGKAMTVLRIALIPDVEALCDKIEREQADLVAKVVAAYPEAIKREAVKIGELYNPADYRPVEAVGMLLKYQRRWMHFGVPDVLKEIDMARYQAERKRTAEVWAEVKQNGIVLLRKQVAEMVDRLVDTVTAKEGGERKKFFASSVTNLTEFFETFENRNLAGDTELAAEVARLKDLVTGKDVKAFKDDDALRATIKKAGSEIGAKLKTMLVDASARTITFEEDEK